MYSETQSERHSVILIREILIWLIITSALVTAALYSHIGITSEVLLSGGFAVGLLILQILLMRFDESGSRIGENLSQSGILGIIVLAASCITLWIAGLLTALGNIMIGSLILLHAILDRSRRQGDGGPGPAGTHGHGVGPSISPLRGHGGATGGSPPTSRVQSPGPRGWELPGHLSPCGPGRRVGGAGENGPAHDSEAGPTVPDRGGDHRLPPGAG